MPPDPIEATFAVLYRWRLRPGMEEDFKHAWGLQTDAIRRERGGLGSRLHRAPDGWWAAYALWPDREAWLRSPGPPDLDAAATMRACILERGEPLELDIVSDHLD